MLGAIATRYDIFPRRNLSERHTPNQISNQLVQERDYDLVVNVKLSEPSASWNYDYCYVSYFASFHAQLLEAFPSPSPFFEERRKQCYLLKAFEQLFYYLCKLEVKFDNKTLPRYASFDLRLKILIEA